MIETEGQAPATSPALDRPVERALTLKTEAYYRQLAEQALAEAGIDEPPIPLEQFAEHLCVPIRRVVLPSFFKGAAVNEDGMPVLVLNGLHSEHRQRETLAHLLGHVLVVIDGGTYPRNGDEDHWQADAIAVELVLPKHMVETQARLWFNDYRYLARSFAVDEGRMLERMRSLGIIKGPKGIVWEY